MAIVTIIIKGIAMSYHKSDGLWKVLFPIGECHEVKFKEGQADPGIPLAAANRQISITTENAASSFETGANYEDFLDLTADYSHANGVKMKDGWSERAVLMSIENAEMSVYDYTPTPHMLLQGNNIVFAPAQIGYSAQAVINGERVIVSVDGHPDFPKVFEQDCTLVFDNDCDTQTERKMTDFDMVYSVVESLGPAAEARGQDRFVVAKAPKSSDYPLVVGATYDYSRNDRDPFTGGLPCHLVRVSITEELP